MITILDLLAVMERQMRVEKVEELINGEAKSHISTTGCGGFRSGGVAATENYGGRKWSRWLDVVIYSFNLPHSSVTLDFKGNFLALS